MLVGIGDPLVVFLFELVFVSIWIRIAAPPELLDKSLALVISLELLKCLSLFVSDDVRHILIQPILVSLLEFRLHVAWLVHRVLAFLGFLRKQSQTA